MYFLLITFTIDYAHAITRLPVVSPGQGLKLRALVDFEEKGTQRIAGDEWMIEGPHTYYPRPEVKEVAKVSPQVIGNGCALHMRAQRDLVDKSGVSRVTGEEWLVRKEGAYLPGVYEEVVSLQEGQDIFMDTALHMKAEKTLVDALGMRRYPLNFLHIYHVGYELYVHIQLYL